MSIIPEFIRKMFPEVDFDDLDQDEDFTPECEEDVNEDDDDLALGGVKPPEVVG